jgi:hypothetical protein
MTFLERYFNFIAINIIFVFICILVLHYFTINKSVNTIQFNNNLNIEEEKTVIIADIEKPFIFESRDLLDFTPVLQAGDGNKKYGFIWGINNILFLDN